MALPALLASYVNYGNGSSTGHYAVTAWATGAAKTVGNLIRQLAAPTVGNERIFVCIIAGTTHASTEPTWTVTRGAKTTDNTVTWQECTGQPATNGDLTNTRTWTSSKAAASTPSLGVIIKDGSNNLFICTTSGAMGGSEPTWDTTVGNTTADSGAVWTCISNGAFGAWAAPHARIANSFASTWGAAGDTFYVGGNHAETQTTAVTQTSPGTLASPCRLLCVNQAGSVPPVSADLATTATSSTTGASRITHAGAFMYAYGITWSSGDGSSIAKIVTAGNLAQGWIYDACVLKVNTTDTTSTIDMNGGSIYRNCTFTFSNASQGWLIGSNTVNPLVLGGSLTGTAVTTLVASTNNTSRLTVIGCDLSLEASGKTLVSLAGSTASTDFLFIDCKLGASVTLSGGTIASHTCSATFINCDSGDTNYRYHFANYSGTITQETIIVRTGGASDGVTTVSRKMVTTANAKTHLPIYSDWIEYWNDAVGGSLTVKIVTVTDNVTLTDAEAWIEVEYLGTSGVPLGAVLTDRAADVLATPANQTTSSDTWTTTGLTTPVKQELSKAVTPQEKGLIRARVALAKASTTMYFDPKLQVS